MDEEKKDVTLSKEELQAVFKEFGETITKGFTDATTEMKAIAEKSRANEVGEDAKKDLLHTNADFRLSTLLCAMKSEDKEKIKEIEAIEKAAAPLNVTTSADGGVFVPALTELKIKELAITYGQAYQDFEVMPMGQNVVNLPKESTAATVYWVGENESITESKEQFGSDTLTPKKVAALTAISNELLKVPTPAIGAYVTRKMGIRILRAIDSKVYQNGNTTLTGLFYASNSFGNSEPTANTNPNSVLFQQFVDCVYGLDSAKLVGATWRMHRTIAAIVRTLKDDSGRYIWENGSEGLAPTILGFPVKLVESAPNADAEASKPIVVLGNGMNSTLGDIGGVVIDIFNSGVISDTNLIHNDLSGIRAVKQVAFTPGLVSEYSIIQTAAA